LGFFFRGECNFLLPGNLPVHLKLALNVPAPHFFISEGIVIFKLYRYHLTGFNTTFMNQPLPQNGEVEIEVNNGAVDQSGPVIEAHGAKQPSQNRHHSKGILLIGIGVVLCVTGFILVITQESGATFNFALYGMTGTGGSCLVGGLALIMG